jgi:hypothetical protein
MNCENILSEDGLINAGNYPNSDDDGVFHIVSREEFNDLAAEHAKEVEGMSYEEYCDIEQEAWNEMLKEQLKSPWEKSIPDFIMDPKQCLINKRTTKKPISTAAILNALAIKASG